MMNFKKLAPVFAAGALAAAGCHDSGVKQTSAAATAPVAQPEIPLTAEMKERIGAIADRSKPEDGEPDFRQKVKANLEQQAKKDPVFGAKLAVLETCDASLILHDYKREEEMGVYFNWQTPASTCKVHFPLNYLNGPKASMLDKSVKQLGDMVKISFDYLVQPDLSPDPSAPYSTLRDLAADIRIYQAIKATLPEGAASPFSDITERGARQAVDLHDTFTRWVKEDKSGQDEQDKTFKYLQLNPEFVNNVKIYLDKKAAPQKPKSLSL